MTDKTFAELYCEKHGLKLEQYQSAVLMRSLYPHARWLAPLVGFFWPQHFAADADFVRSVGLLRRFREFAYEAEEFAHHPANRGFWRRTVNVRVSSRALRRMVRAALHPELEAQEEGGGRTSVPFAGSGGKPVAPGRKHSTEASA